MKSVRERTREQEQREVSACATNDWPLISIDAGDNLRALIVCTGDSADTATLHTESSLVAKPIQPVVTPGGADGKSAAVLCAPDLHANMQRADAKEQ